MAMVPDDARRFGMPFGAVSRAVPSPSRVDDAVRADLRVKFEMGLFEQRACRRGNATAVGSEADRARQREVVARSQVLL